MKLSELPLSYFFNPSERLFWGYLLSSTLIAGIVFYWRYQHIPNKKTIKRYWLHPSAMVDYQYFFVIWFFKVYLVAPLIFSARDMAIWTHRFSRDYLTPLFDVPYETVGWLYTITLFVVSDFTRYWLHRALHACDFLWVFHKVHHSAEILNPVTFYRIHPVESFLFGLRYSLSSGLVTGVFITLFGAKLGIHQIIGVNLFIFAFSILGNNLRHSSVYLGFPKWLERLFISPAQHQLHHQYHHSRTNYGGALAIWDYLFGSLRHSYNTPKPKRLGIAQNEMSDYDSVTKLLVSPFKQMLNLARYRFGFVSYFKEKSTHDRHKK